MGTGSRRGAVVMEANPLGLPPPITWQGERLAKLVSRVEAVSEQRHRCAYCGDKIKQATATADHVMPKSKGGRTEKGNIAAACRPCNSAKGAMPVDAFKKALRVPQSRHSIEVMLASMRFRINRRGEQACSRILQAAGLSAEGA